MTNGRGRPAKHYKSSWGETIQGLCLRANGRFYPVGISNVSFGADEKLAIHRFRQWQAEQSDQLEPLDDIGFAYDAIENYKEHLRSLILLNPRQAAIELNIPHLAEYPVTREIPEMTLVQYGDFYLNNKRNKQGQPLADKHRKNSLKWWQDFCEFMDVQYARDITPDLIRAYRDDVMSHFDNGKSAAYVSSRYIKVKAFLNYCLTHVDGDKDDLRKLLDLCRMLVAPLSVTNPEPISVDDFHKLIAAAHPRERAMMMLGLNMAGHGGEVTAVLKTEIDLKARTLACRRTKNTLPRVAHLWKRTVQAIRDYQKTCPRNKSAYLFVTDRGTPMYNERFRQCYKNLRDRIGVDSTFEGFRDAAYTVMSEVDPTHAKYVAGHKVGMSDKYVLRQASNKQVIACCEAVETYFFAEGK